MFVTKLLRERTGNCRSLSYYYKILADECGVEAFLALAPNHIYIKHRDVGQKKEGWQRRVYNIELTNGSFPMDGWLMASGYITLDAIRSGYYLDTLSQSQAVAMCLFDLAKAYERKFGKRDEFVSRCVERVLEIHPANINALLLKTELLKDRYEQTKAPADYQNVEKHCSTLVANGYREMPLDMYLNWLFEVRAKGDAFVNVKRQPKKFDTQKGNPYKNDTTMKIHMQTLTDGRYDEFPEFAETTYVGSAVYDVYKKRIIGFIKRDTLYSEATLEPEVVSRWLSTDPVFHPYESPYTAFANNPVYFIDPRGKSVDDYYINRDGSIIRQLTTESSDRFFVQNEDGSFNNTPNFSLERTHIGKGAVKSGAGSNSNGFDLVYFPDRGAGFSSYASSKNMYVQPLMAAALLGASADFETQHPYNYINFGNMGTAGGDIAQGHPGAGWGHKLGLSVDIGYIGTDGNSNAYTGSRNFDLDKNADMVNSFAKFGMPTSSFRMLSASNSLIDATSKKVTFEGHHADHLHIDAYGGGRLGVMHQAIPKITHCEMPFIENTSSKTDNCSFRTSIND